MINGFYDQNNNLNLEIHARITVKDNAPYWYVGLNTKNGLKALLVDGTSGKILAIREIY